jgi:hypothetical protein
MNLKVPIEILDELAETVTRSTGSLDLASGEIFDVRYEVDRPGLMGMPAVDEQYEFTSGVLSNDGKDVEFRIDVDVMRGQYFVNPTELLERISWFRCRTCPSVRRPGSTSSSLCCRPRPSRRRWRSIRSRSAPSRRTRARTLPVSTR